MIANTIHLSFKEDINMCNDTAVIIWTNLTVTILSQLSENDTSTQEQIKFWDLSTQTNDKISRNRLKNVDKTPSFFFN